MTYTFETNSPLLCPVCDSRCVVIYLTKIDSGCFGSNMSHSVSIHSLIPVDTLIGKVLLWASTWEIHVIQSVSADFYPPQFTWSTKRCFNHYSAVFQKADQIASWVTGNNSRSNESITRLIKGNIGQCIRMCLSDAHKAKQLHSFQICIAGYSSLVDTFNFPDNQDQAFRRKLFES